MELRFCWYVSACAPVSASPYNPKQSLSIHVPLIMSWWRLRVGLRPRRRRPCPHPEPQSNV